MLEWCLERHVHMISDEVRDAQRARALRGTGYPGLHALHDEFGLRHSLGDAFQGINYLFGFAEGVALAVQCFITLGIWVIGWQCAEA